MATGTESMGTTEFGLIHWLFSVVTDYSYDDHGVWIDLCNAAMGGYS